MDPPTDPMTTLPSSYPAIANPVVVIDYDFCAQDPVDLTMVKKKDETDFAVIDENGNVLFKLIGALYHMHERHLLVDAQGNPIASLRAKLLTAHKRWQVFRGESSDMKELLFSAKRSSVFQHKTDLDVFLASNTSEDSCDFTVRGSWEQRSCTVYTGDGSNVLAQMHRKYTSKSLVLGGGKESFSMMVYPQVDHAFVLAVLAILSEIQHDPDEPRVKCS